MRSRRDLLAALLERRIYFDVRSAERDVAHLLSQPVGAGGSHLPDPHRALAGIDTAPADVSYDEHWAYPKSAERRRLGRLQLDGAQTPTGSGAHLIWTATP